MAAGLAVHARATRRALIALALGAATASAAPKGREARAAFDDGLAAYKRKDYDRAALSFARSDDLEPDVETEYAWAQAERKAGNCAKALQLYQRLLANPTLPSANRSAVLQQLEECRAIIAETAEPPDKPEKPTERRSEKPPAPVVDDRPEQPAAPASRAWWKDPIGGSLVTVGVLGGAVGGYFLYTGHTAEVQSQDADNFFEFDQLHDKARTRGQIGVIATATGGVLLVGGILWYALQPGGAPRPRVTAWLAPSGGGIAGSF